jgi:radical SAM superfamily enzyme YgiQ (UPF0313 family)
MMLDQDESFWQELLQHHISGQLKVAPEHVAPGVLRLMGKPGCAVYDAFCQKYKAMNDRLRKNQYLVPYFISAHPGSTLKDAIELAIYLKRIGHQPEQVQDFYPTPGTLSTAMWHTGQNPLTGEAVYVPKSEDEKLMQRALLQFQNPLNHALVRRALQKAGRADLIGYGPRCLVPPERARGEKKEETKAGRANKNGPSKPGRPKNMGKPKKKAGKSPK